jgi:predicted ATPase
MVTGVAGDKTLPPEVLQQIVTKSDGVPLFVEELTKMVLESGLLWEHDGHYVLAEPLAAVAIPSTLQDSLMARLDRLTTAKSVAQLGATLGRAFSYEVLRAVSTLDETTLQQELARLVAGELLYQRGVPPQATYVFKHVLIQEVAYQSLLKSTRQQYHRRIAQVLEELFPETAETQPELLAQHYTEAGLSAQAIPYWQRAGQRAFQRSANLEAVAHLTTGLALLATLPETPARAQQELDLQIALGPALMATRGYAAPEVERVYTRARQLCQQVGEMPQLFRVLWGLWLFYFVRAQLQSAYELGEQLLTHAQRAQDPMLLIEAQRALGATLWFLGEFVTAQRYLEQGTTLYDMQQHHSLAFVYGQDPKVTCLSYAAWALWVLGYPDQALWRSHEALSLAQELSHPFTLVFALSWAAMVHKFRRERQMAQERVETLMTIARERGFTQRLAAGTMMQGWALVEQGRSMEKGVAQILQGLAAFRATGTEVGRPKYLTLLVEAYGKVGQREEGLSAVAEALAMVHQNADRCCEAELYRLKGTLLLQAGIEQKEAEACFQQALAVARHQQAKAWELRAALSLSRLWQQQGKCAAAYDLLAPVYGWFTEGFDTADLQEARALLAALR